MGVMQFRLLPIIQRLIDARTRIENRLLTLDHRRS
jgi:hypothetical protein